MVPVRIRSVPAPYFLRIRVPLYGAGTEQTRARHGPDTEQPFSDTRKKEMNSANGY